MPLIAETVQSKVGALFGVSGTVVVFVVIYLAVMAVQHNEKPSPTTGTVKTTTYFCSDGKHDQCPGRYSGPAGAEGDCSCTCHRPALTSLCGDHGRHDACEGLVRMPSGAIRECGCTCHARGKTGHARVQSGAQGALPAGARLMAAHDVRGGYDIVIKGVAKRVVTIQLDSSDASLRAFHFGDGTGLVARADEVMTVLL